MRARIVPLLLALAALAPACEWDRDTLSEEASLGRDYLAAITGRFPRNPPLYYAMRRDRVLAKRIKTEGDYDDLAVALDKLGDPASARMWIERKPKGDAESRYRTLANRGTFLVHAWLTGRSGQQDAEEGLRSLQAAVHLNPAAHFGREFVQIDLVRALLDPNKAEFHTLYEGAERKAPAEREAQGYAGIVRLGAGWESPDVFRAFAVSLAGTGKGALAQAAVDRAEELERNGAKTRLDPKTVFPMIEGLQMEGILREDTRRQYDRLRREADAWQARRNAFMLPRLKAGRHPDTDPAFWQGWMDVKSPEVETDVVRFQGFPLSRQGYAVVILILVALVGIPLALGAWVVRLWRKAVRIEPS